MYLGIDFGTSFSQVATMYLEQPLLLLNPGDYGIPSEFYYDRESGILIGQDALDAGQGDAAANLVSEVKMALRSGRTFQLDGRTFTGKEIVQEIYRALLMKAVQMAKRHSLNTEMEGVVISIPAKFGMQERYLISQAARDCLGSGSVPLKAIIKEPVAAALAYYTMELEDNRYILVYDLGGGTCDVALVRSDSSQNERFTVEDSDMVRLGGRNWDEALVRYLTEVFETQSGVQIRGNVGFEEKLRRTAIAVKHSLSEYGKSRAVARIELNGRLYTAPVLLTTFNEITADLLSQTLACLQDVYDRNCARCKIDEIICVGGSSNMQQVEAGLLEQFPQCKIRIYKPEHAVVNGAAWYAEAAKGILVDKANFSYGTDCFYDFDSDPNHMIISNIIRKGDRLPAQGCQYFRPVRDGQSVLQFSIFESEFQDETYEFTDANKRFVGNVELNLPDDATKKLSVACKISLNTEGLLEVEASEPSGRRMASRFKIENL